MQNKHKRADWDSSFLGFEVGKIEADSNQINAEEILGISKNYKLAYVFSPVDLNRPGQQLPGQIKLTDTKIKFGAGLENIPQLPGHDENIQILSEETDELMDLVFLSGKFSRFNLDKKFRPTVFFDLYRQWIQKSLSGDLANIVAGYVLNEKIAGFITLKITGKELSIGLIAVGETYQGMGIGKKLISFAGNYGRSQQLDLLTVETQLENTPACRLYAGMQLQEINRTYIYHIWN